MKVPSQANRKIHAGYARRDAERQGVVTLNGTIESEQMRHRAGELARQVDGVVRVQNNLTVR